MAIRTSRTFDVIFVAVLLAGLSLAALNRVAVGDWIFERTHTASDRVNTIATQADLTPEGRRLLARTNPQFVGQSVVDNMCGKERLGCLMPGGQAYILDEASNPGQTTVTAVHEMLHLAYQRLTDAELDALEPEIDSDIARYQRQIDPELEGETDAADRRDEAHSILGTEYAPLGAGLEAYYARYFASRTPVVQAAAASASP